MQTSRDLAKMSALFQCVMNQLLKEEIKVLRSTLYREDYLPHDPSCCIHSGPLLRQLELLEQQLAESEKKPLA